MYCLNQSIWFLFSKSASTAWSRFFLSSPEVTLTKSNKQSHAKPCQSITDEIQLFFLLWSNKHNPRDQGPLKSSTAKLLFLIFRKAFDVASSSQHQSFGKCAPHHSKPGYSALPPIFFLSPNSLKAVCSLGSSHLLTMGPGLEEVVWLLLARSVHTQTICEAVVSVAVTSWMCWHTTQILVLIFFCYTCVFSIVKGRLFLGRVLEII